MRRADRLIELVSRLRAKPIVRADDIARALEVSVRTVYRDIAALQAQGLPIEGAAGIGYAVRGKLDLPPLTFGHDELEALALGLSYVEQVGDVALAAGARRPCEDRHGLDGLDARLCVPSAPARQSAA